MNNRRITDLGGGKTREAQTNEPALETSNSRVEQLGSWRQANVAASQAAVALAFQSVDTDASGSLVAGRAGVIMGVAWDLTAAVTAGTGTVQATVGGTVKGDVVNVAAATQTGGETEQTTPIPFNKGDKLGAKLTTNGAFAPTTTDLQVWLIVKWTPTSIEP